MDENTSSEDYIRSLLQIPSQYAILNILAVGYPAETKSPHDEEKLAYNKVHFEKF
jgi:nitroreductase